jgi:hypothetical protein
VATQWKNGRGAEGSPSRASARADLEIAKELTGTDRRPTGTSRAHHLFSPKVVQTVGVGSAMQAGWEFDESSLPVNNPCSFLLKVRCSLLEIFMNITLQNTDLQSSTLESQEARDILNTCYVKENHAITTSIIIHYVTTEYSYNSTTNVGLLGKKPHPFDFRQMDGPSKTPHLQSMAGSMRAKLELHIRNVQRGNAFPIVNQKRDVEFMGDG